MENIGKMDSRVLNVDVDKQSPHRRRWIAGYSLLQTSSNQRNTLRGGCAETQGTVGLRGGLPPEVFSRYIISKHLLVFTALFAALFGYPGGDTLLTIQAT